jgi:hypothetical protein
MAPQPACEGSYHVVYIFQQLPAKRSKVEVPIILPAARPTYAIAAWVFFAGKDPSRTGLQGHVGPAAEQTRG